MNFQIGKTKSQPMLIGIFLGGNGGPPRGGNGLLNNSGDPFNGRSGPPEVGNDSLGSGGNHHLAKEVVQLQGVVSWEEHWEVVMCHG